MAKQSKGAKMASIAVNIDEMAEKHAAMRKPIVHQRPKQVQQNQQYNRKERITSAYTGRSNAVHLKDMTSGLHPAVRAQISMMGDLKN